MVFAIERTGTLGSDGTATHGGSPTGSDKPRATATSNSSTTPLVILSTSGVAAIYASSGSNTALSIGLSYAILTSLALVLVGRARAESQHGAQNGGSTVIYSANGFLSQPDKPSLSASDITISVIRDVSAAAAVGTGVAALALESFSFGGLAYWGVLGQAMGDRWVLGQAVLNAVFGLGMVVVHLGMEGALLVMVSPPLPFPMVCVV